MPVELETLLIGGWYQQPEDRRDVQMAFHGIIQRPLGSARFSGIITDYVGEARVLGILGESGLNFDKVYKSMEKTKKTINYDYLLQGDIWVGQYQELGGSLRGETQCRLLTLPKSPGIILLNLKLYHSFNPPGTHYGSWFGENLRRGR